MMGLSRPAVTPGLAGRRLPWNLRVLLPSLAVASFMTQATVIPALKNNIGPFEILGGLLIASVLLSPRTQRPLRLHPVIQVTLAIFAVAIVSQLNIPETRELTGVINVAILGFLSLFLVALYNIMRQYRIGPDTVLMWVCFALLIVGPWVLWSGYASDAAIQAAGPFRNRAHMASYMLTAFWMALAFVQWPRLSLPKRLIGYGGVAMTLYAVAVSGRRSVYLSLFVGLALLAVVFAIAQRGKRTQLFAASIFAVALLVAMYQYGPRYLPQLGFFQSRIGMIDDRLELALGVNEDEVAEKSFFALQREGVRQAFEAHPLIGIGWGGFARSHYSPTGHEVHSTPMRFLAEMGLAGIVLYLALLGALAWSISRSWLAMRRTPFANTYLILAAGYCSLLLSYLYNRHITERTFWLLMVTILGAELFARRHLAATRQARTVRQRAAAPPSKAAAVPAPGAEAPAALTNPWTEGSTS